MIKYQMPVVVFVIRLIREAKRTAFVLF